MLQLKQLGQEVGTRDAKVFYSSLFEFFTEAVRYELKKLPTHDKILQHARFLDVIDRVKHKFSSVEYFR